MKKCPECGNPSYDGAPVCGNCGFKFPKPKVAAPKQESIFEKVPKEVKSPSNKRADSNEPSTLDILIKNKLLIGIILLITLIVICGIVLTAPNNNSNSNTPTTGNLLEFANGDFSFKYPESWKQINGTDESHSDAVFFEDGNNNTIEYYNSTQESSTLKEITLERIDYAREGGAYVEFVQSVILDGRNATDVIFENYDGSYTRYISVFNAEGTLHVFKISGPSFDSVTADEINSVLNSAKIQ